VQLKSLSGHIWHSGDGSNVPSKQRVAAELVEPRLTMPDHNAVGIRPAWTPEGWSDIRPAMVPTAATYLTSDDCRVGQMTGSGAESGPPTQVAVQVGQNRTHAVDNGKPQLQFQLRFICVQHRPRRYTPCSDLHGWTLVDVRKRRVADS
jgi:hypothetical protein